MRPSWPQLNLFRTVINPVRGSLGLERLAIVGAGAAGLSGLPWPAAALAGAAVYLLTELSTRDAPELQRLSDWQIGAWRTGAAFIGVGHCCLSWAIDQKLDLQLDAARKLGVKTADIFSRRRPGFGMTDRCSRRR